MCYPFQVLWAERVRERGAPHFFANRNLTGRRTRLFVRRDGHYGMCSAATTFNADEMFQWRMIPFRMSSVGTVKREKTYHCCSEERVHPIVEDECLSLALERHGKGWGKLALKI